MLTFRILPYRNINQFIKKSSQQLHKSASLLTAKDSSSSSSSSDSSDSDSDREDNIVKKAENVQTKVDSNKIPDTTARLDALLNQMSMKKKQSQESVKSINVAIKPKADRFKNTAIKVEDEKKPFEDLVISAAKSVAKTIQGDTKENELELLSKVLNLKPSSSEKEESTVEQATPTTVDLSYLITGMKVDESMAKVNHLQERRQKAVKKIQERFDEPSISKSLLHAKTVKFKKLKASEVKSEFSAVVKPLGIFTNVPKDKKSRAPTLETWEAMEVREMKLSVLTSPQNVFEELIQWTDQGKLWHFPINNEQGMEEEEKVHFSEHVFMERHLKGWCPRRGPIRHFMELVCTGLSKNPYMTVEEKIGHITWYRNYFEDKKALLDELGVLDNIKVSSLESKEKKKIEA